MFTTTKRKFNVENFLKFCIFFLQAEECKVAEQLRGVIMPIRVEKTVEKPRAITADEKKIQVCMTLWVSSLYLGTSKNT